MQVTSKILLLQNLMTDLSKWLGLDRFADAKSQYDEDGYLVFENILSSNELTAIKDALKPYLDTPLKAGMILRARGRTVSMHCWRKTVFSPS